MQKFVTNSEKETIELGNRLGKTLKPATVVAFYGGLGMGKTTFTRGLAKALGSDADVSSPTFAIVNDYGGNPHLYHFDMYRVESWDDLYSSGFFDYLDSGAVLAVEWSENVEDALERPIVVDIRRDEADENTRHITVTGGQFDADLSL